AVQRSRTVRHPPRRGRPSRVRDREPLLSGRLVRPASGPRLSRHRARPVAQPPARSRASCSGLRLGVPGAPFDVGALGPAVTGRTPARAETVGSLLRPRPLKAAAAAFYTPGHSAVLEEERSKDRSELRALEDDAIR